MTSSIATAEVLKELKALRKDLRSLRNALPEKGMFLTTEEKKLLDESYSNEAAGRLVSSKSLRRELGL